MQSIASTGFGIDTSAFDDAKSAELRKHARKITMADSTWLDIAKGLLGFLAPGLSKALRIEISNKQSLLFFVDIVRETVALRLHSAQKRNDLVDFFMEALHMDGDEEGGGEAERHISISPEKRETALISQLLLLLFAGMDTSSTILAVCMCCLANNPHVQVRIRHHCQGEYLHMSQIQFLSQEVLYDEIKNMVEKQSMKEAELDYHTIQSLPYLDMVVHETLRFFPLGDVERKCVKEYRIPGTNFVIPKGMIVQLPVTGIMMDEKYFPEPESFNPENFSQENKQRRSPYAFLAFGMGPRNCVGSRLALLQIKVAIIHLVYKCKVLSCPKTPKELTVDPKWGPADVKGGIWLKFRRRNNICT